MTWESLGTGWMPGQGGSPRAALFFEVGGGQILKRRMRCALRRTMWG